MACRADWYTHPLQRASRGREGSTSSMPQFNLPVEPEECLVTTLIVVFGSVNTQGPRRGSTMLQEHPTEKQNALRLEFEASRVAFHDLLDSLSAADFKKKSLNS